MKLDDKAYKWDGDPLPDNINPSHYKTGKIECIDYIIDVLGVDGAIAYCRGNSIKYEHRLLHKGDAVENLKKKIWYDNKVLELMEKKDN